ncbi:hypothetical protein Micbo1qcDRAFT_172589 [Microdochium bolleyi]|uniref:Uncharacterized protein n=1 Tax=Microdochium bolleyi TaxID=196109 RepID=A0A136J934_9PEZI|nr:hypothetical protein Micbo1qcDRAFT_172589 [Microdochium bolleyi]
MREDDNRSNRISYLLSIDPIATLRSVTFSDCTHVPTPAFAGDNSPETATGSPKAGLSLVLSPYVYAYFSRAASDRQLTGRAIIPTWDLKVVDRAQAILAESHNGLLGTLLDTTSPRVVSRIETNRRRAHQLHTRLNAKDTHARKSSVADEGHELGRSCAKSKSRMLRMERGDPGDMIPILDDPGAMRDHEFSHRD